MDELDQRSLEVLAAAFYAENADLEARLTDDVRFAHYTSADTALRIIRGAGTDRALWLRNATVMNDFSEIEFGQNCLAACLPKPEIVRPLEEVATALGIDIRHDLFGPMDAERLRIKRDTFLLSLSEHHKDTTTGRLSMWRAYGGLSNVCLLLKTDAIKSPQDAYDVELTAVDYEGQQGFEDRFGRLIANMRANTGEMKGVSPYILTYNLKAALDQLVLSTKHPAFSEEEEWRIIYRRKSFAPRPPPPSKVAMLSGVAQIVHYLPMRDVPDRGIRNATLDALLERIIIGPTEDPQLVYEAFVHELTAAGISNAEGRVTHCNIPLRRR